LSNIEEITLYKFGPGFLNFQDNVNITPQVIELNLYESIFAPVLRAELVMNDAIGLFTNFPLTGEEVVKITYEDAKDNFSRTEWFVVESVEDIQISDDNRVASYIINLVSFEAWANSRRTVQRAYRGNLTDAATDIFKEFIEDEIKKLTLNNIVKPLTISPSSETDRIMIIPNLKPFAAIKFISKLIVSSTDDLSYMFYQNSKGYYLRSLEDIFLSNRTAAARLEAKENGYKYTSDELINNDNYSNEGRLITNINFNRRHGTLQKIDLGYFQNKYVEINIAQKGYKITETKVEDVEHISPNKFNTTYYMNTTPVQNATDKEYSNRTKYVVTTDKEGDISFPVSELRDRWGKELIEQLALSQVDLTVTMEGDTSLNVGELFYVEIPEAHGFNKNEEDDLISGYYIITEKRDSILQDGTFTTSLRIQKDSYNSSVDRNSEYNESSDEDMFYI
jgi:hypothetical protein